jgi:gas vesicle protein
MPGLIIGLFIGAVAGMFFTALCVAAGRGNKDAETDIHR